MAGRRRPPRQALAGRAGQQVAPPCRHAARLGAHQRLQSMRHLGALTGSSTSAPVRPMLAQLGQAATACCDGAWGQVGCRQVVQGMPCLPVAPSPPVCSSGGGGQLASARRSAGGGRHQPAELRLLLGCMLAPGVLGCAPGVSRRRPGCPGSAVTHECTANLPHSPHSPQQPSSGTPAPSPRRPAPAGAATHLDHALEGRVVVAEGAERVRLAVRARQLRGGDGGSSGPAAGGGPGMAMQPAANCPAHCACLPGRAHALPRCRASPTPSRSSTAAQCPPQRPKSGPAPGPHLEQQHLEAVQRALQPLVQLDVAALGQRVELRGSAHGGQAEGAAVSTRSPLAPAPARAQSAGRSSSTGGPAAPAFHAPPHPPPRTCCSTGARGVPKCTSCTAGTCRTC